MEFQFGTAAQNTTETGETQPWWKRNVLDFQRKKGWGGGTEIKGYGLTVEPCSRQRPAQGLVSLILNQPQQRPAMTLHCLEL